MIIQCESCSRKFVVKDSDIPQEGRTVQCGFCSVTWHQLPISEIPKTSNKLKLNKPVQEINESLSIDSIKASDGKTYKFLGSQWAELLPSGKTGLFAKKKIGQELDKLTGRKERKTLKKKQKKIGRDEIEISDHSMDPSSDEIGKQQSYNNKKGLGFFGYVFLIIIITLSIIGIAKTFEDDLLNYFPETEYIFDFIDEQLIYTSESIENIIIVIQELINSY